MKYIRSLFSQQYFWLLLIILLALFLRFYQLGANPPSLTWDEAAWGYNAYSLGLDGKDEFGKFLPLSFLESFGDYKPPLYAYLDVIPVKLFGLNEFSTRFPSAFFGTLAVLLTFFLVRRIFYNSKHNEKIALASAFFLAISPWHIMLSRAAFEANVASFLIIFAVLTFLMAIQNRRWILILSAVSFALAFYTFNTARVVSPILAVILALLFWKKLLTMKKVVAVSIVVGVLFMLPILRFLFTPQATLRFNEVNIFSDVGIINTSNQEIANDGNTFLSRVIHNRRLLYTAEYLKHYLDNLNPGFLFIRGDVNPKFSTQNVGQMYLWDLPFFIIGILLLFKKRESYWWLVPLWLIIGIIPAATARETPHALRIENSLPGFQIIAAYGFILFLEKIKKYKYIIATLLFMLLALNFLYFYNDYKSNYKYIYSRDWQYSYKQSIEYVRSVEKDFDYIQVTKYLGRPYIYYLFYTKQSPQEFRKTATVKRDVFGFVAVTGFGKYLFPENFDHSIIGKKVLYINASNAVPKQAKILKQFNLLNGDEDITAYTM